MTAERPAAAYTMTIDASFPPLGIVLVRMSPRIYFIYPSDQILLTRTQWPKDALIPDLARGCCLRSSRGPASNLATGSKHKRFILGFWLWEVPLHLSQELAGELRPAKHLIGCPRGSAKAGAHQRDQAKLE